MASEKELRWIERLVGYLGPEVPPVPARILGWLMICEPAEQSAAEIAAAIRASRASLTTGLRFLSMAGFVTKITKTADRTAYYCVLDGAWAGIVQRQIDSIEVFRVIAADGLELVGKGNSEQASRLRDARAVFDWMANAFRNAPPLPKNGRKP